MMISPDTVRISKFGSWVTSAGHADWYTVETNSPEYKGDYADKSSFLVYRVSFYSYLV